MSGTPKPDRQQTVEQQWRAEMLAAWREMVAVQREFLVQARRIADAAHGPYGGSSQ